MLDNTNTLILTTDDGQEVEMEIVLTFDNEETGRHYVLITDPQDPEGDVFAYTYDEDGNLDAVSDASEYEMCAEVLSAFQGE